MKTAVGQAGSLIRRSFGMVRRNPAMLYALSRMEYRYRIGIPFDRRFRPGLSAPPSSLSINLTMRCNLRCRMCRRIHDDRNIPENRPWYRRDRELSLSVWRNLLDQVRSFRPWLYVTGGEPLLSPYFREFVMEAKERRFPLQLQTNGTLLEKVGEFLVSAGVEAVTVSVDGPPDIHDRIRGVAGSFRRLEKGIRALVEARKRLGSPYPFLSINCTVTKTNAGHLHKMAPLAIKMKADALQIQHTMFNFKDKVAQHNQCLSSMKARGSGPAMDALPILHRENYESELDRSDLPGLQMALSQARKLARGRIIFNVMPGISREFHHPYYFDPDYPFMEGCDDFWQVFRVLADGTVSPCLNFVVGDIKRQTVMAIWKGRKMQQLRRMISKGLFPGCMRCCHRYYLKSNRAF